MTPLTRRSASLRKRREPNRIVLAYAGGLHSSLAIPWLAETYATDVVTVTTDLGQGTSLPDIRDRALSLGAVRAHVVDGREEFARRFVLPALQAGAVYEGRYPLSTALGLPLIAKHLVEIAKLEGATAVAHGGGEAGNDQLRLDSSVRALDPTLEVIAPAAIWAYSAAELVAAAKRQNLLASSSEGPYVTDRNLWGRSVACDLLEDPWQEPPEEAYELTRMSAAAPDAPAYVEVSFDRGVPTSVNGVDMSLPDLVQSLETIAGTHGVGRIDMVENGPVGQKSREIYEAPAAVVLHAAHRELQQLVTPRDLERLTGDLAVTYADLVYNGFWFSLTREAIDALVATVQSRVSGTVRAKLFKGDCRVVGRQSPHALYEGASPPPTPDPAAAQRLAAQSGIPVRIGSAPGGRASGRSHRPGGGH